VPLGNFDLPIGHKTWRKEKSLIYENSIKKFVVNATIDLGSQKNLILRLWLRIWSCKIMYIIESHSPITNSSLPLQLMTLMSWNVIWLLEMFVKCCLVAHICGTKAPYSWGEKSSIGGSRRNNVMINIYKGNLPYISQSS